MSKINIQAMFSAETEGRTKKKSKECLSERNGTCFSGLNPPYHARAGVSSICQVKPKKRIMGKFRMEMVWNCK